MSIELILRNWTQVEKLFENDPIVVLDYETSSLSCYHVGFFVAGMGLCGVNSKKTVYIRFYDFWRTPEEQTFPKELKERIGKWLLSKHLVVFNVQYEAGVSLAFFNVYLRNVTDIMLWNRMLGESGTLKEVAQRRLGVVRWTSEVDEWNDIVGNLWKQCKDTPAGIPKWEISLIKEKLPATIGELLNHISPTGPDEAIIKKRGVIIYENLERLENLISKYYSGDRKIEFTKRFFALLDRRASRRDEEIRYTDIPIEIIAPYAADDVKYTCDLYPLMKREIEDRGLARAGEIYQAHGRLGFEIESAGIAWNDDLAETLSAKYHTEACNRLRKLLLNPKFIRILELSAADILKIQTTTVLEDLTNYFNPRSNHPDTRKKFSNLFVTGRVRFMLMLHQVFDLYTSVGEDQCRKSYPVLTDLVEMIIEEKDPKDKLELLEGFVGSTITKKVQNHLANSQENWHKNGSHYTPEIDLMIKYAAWEVTTTSSEMIEEAFKSFTDILGVDVDKPETYTEEFEVLFDFRMYKKVMKSFSTYIWGKMGRESVCLIDKDKVRELLQERRPGWIEKLPEDKIWISEGEWGVVTAETRRWRSGLHTVPPSSELIDLRISRFPDGVRIKWDYAQMEVRVLAKAANDENMLQAFRDGIDIHSLIAQRVWKKPKVSKAERRFAKATTFAVLYGDTPEGAAFKFMNGDVARSKEMFSNFFEGFPNIKVWIKEQHKHALTHGYIKTMFGDPINVMPSEAMNLSLEERLLLVDNLWTKDVKFSRNHNEDTETRTKIAKALRNAQNSGIQSVSSMLTGLSLSYLSDWMRDEGLTSRVDCFTHDAGDIDCQVADLPKILTILPKFSVEAIRGEFGIPVETDYEIGIMADHSLELHDMIIDKNIITSRIEGKKEGLKLLIDRLERYGVKCEVEIEKEEIEHRSLSELFISRRALSLDMGRDISKIHGKVKLDFKDVRRE